MAQKHWNLHQDCYIIVGKGKRENILIIRLSDVVGVAVTAAAPKYEMPIRYKFLMRGGHEIEIDEPDECIEAQLQLRDYVEHTGGHTHYI